MFRKRGGKIWRLPETHRIRTSIFIDFSITTREARMPLQKKKWGKEARNVYTYAVVSNRLLRSLTSTPDPTYLFQLVQSRNIDPFSREL